MTEAHILTITLELNLNANQVRATAELLAQDATVPFIARYRKEATDSLDEVAITAIRDRLEQLTELDKRRETILTSLEENGHLTDELKEKVLAAKTLAVLEDIYLPYRPKRRTRASIAREKGLEPLAQHLFDQEDFDPETEAATFIDAEKGVETAEDALSGARDIVAEWISEHADARARMRDLFATTGIFKSRLIPGKEEEGTKFKDYFEWDEAVSEAPSHRILAMRRGEKEGFLSMRIAPPEVDAHALLESLFIKNSNLASGQVRLALEDSYKRLLAPSMETEIRLETKKQADAEAIRIFTENLRELLLSPPLGQRNVLAIDPGFRTGCKLVCLNRQGKLLHTDTVYPGQGAKRDTEAAEKITAYSKQYDIEAIAIGNGTGGRELETFIRNLELSAKISIVMVNESGASVYSASEAAREEFADHDLTVRGSVSIGRRLMDPLAELVKIDPKSIGVGQYQHDVDQPALKKSLDDTVVSCVNAVGVEANTASKQILTYVSGLGPQLAQNIVAYRDETGPFASRKDLKKVPRLGPKAFEQAAGFLRIRDAENPLDASAVHPESYPVVETMARDLDCSVTDLIQNETLRTKIDPTKYVTETVGLPTIQDILAELAKPGRDPRQQFEAFHFAEGVEKMEDLNPGMSLPGIVTNVTAFGAFVDVGVHQDGLVHISQLADRFVKDPSEIVKVHQRVTVTVREVDLARKRIALSMRKNPEAAGPARSNDAPKPDEKKKSRPRRTERKPQQKQEPERPGSAFAEALRKAGLS
ncbi:MAG: Tex family protein [bacterium]|nr:Tex family protein [bacterium]